MNRRIFAVALLCLRAALRSRIITSLLALLALLILFLPGLTRGDGTAAGEWRVMVAFPLTGAAIVLALSSLWAGCAVFAGEIEAGRLQMTRIKPIRFLEIWIGHWLGLMLLNVFLAAVVWTAVTTRASARAAISQPGGQSPDRRPHLVFKPDWMDPEAAARKLAEQLEQEGVLPADTPPAELYREAMRRIQAHHPLGPGQSITYPFVLDRPLSREGIYLRLNLGYGVAWRREFKGKVVVGDRESGREVSMKLDTSDMETDRPIRIHAGPLMGARLLETRLIADDDPERQAVLLGREAVSLSLPHGSLATNCIRSAVAIVGVLSVLTALGLLLGSLFSFPVASFCAVAVLLTALISRFVASQGFIWHGDEPSMMALFGNFIVRTADVMASPLNLWRPVAWLAGGTWIGGGVMARAIFLHCLLYPLVIALPAAFILRQREVAK